MRDYSSIERYSDLLNSEVYPEPGSELHDRITGQVFEPSPAQTTTYSVADMPCVPHNQNNASLFRVSTSVASMSRVATASLRWGSAQTLETPGSPPSAPALRCFNVATEAFSDCDVPHSKAAFLLDGQNSQKKRPSPEEDVTPSQAGLPCQTAAAVPRSSIAKLREIPSKISSRRLCHLWSHIVLSYPALAISLRSSSCSR